MKPDISAAMAAPPVVDYLGGLGRAAPDRFWIADDEPEFRLRRSARHAADAGAFRRPRQSDERDRGQFLQPRLASDGRAAADPPRDSLRLRPLDDARDDPRAHWRAAEDDPR